MSQWHEDPEKWAELMPALLEEGALANAAVEAGHAAKLLGLQPGARVLDLCCGPGRHSVELGRLGYEVTGVDSTLLYLETAQRRAAEAGVELELVRESMLVFRREAAFDGLLNLYSSFGYFASRDDDRRVLENMHACLKPGARAVVELMGKEVLARIYVKRHWQELPGGRFWLSEREMLPGWEMMKTFWIFVGNGERKEFTFEHRIYGASELASMMRNAGFSAVEVYGGMDGAPYDSSAMRLVVVGQK